MNTETTVVLTNAALAKVLSEVLTNPFSPEIDDQGQFEAFMTDLAEVVGNYCGARVQEPASYAPLGESLDWGTHYTVLLRLAEDTSPTGLLAKLGVAAEPEIA